MFRFFVVGFCIFFLFYWFFKNSIENDRVYAGFNTIFDIRKVEWKKDGLLYGCVWENAWRCFVGDWKREKSRESRLIERKSMYEQKIWNSREKMREILKIETEEREREKLGRNCWDRSWRVEISERKKLKKEFPKPPKTPPPISVSSCIEFYIKNLFVSPFLARFISTKRKKVCKTNKVCLTLDFCVYDLFVCALLDLFT